MSALMAEMRAAGLACRWWEPLAGGAMILAVFALTTGFLWMVQP